MVEHLTFNQTVVGSNPAALKILQYKWKFNKVNLIKKINFNWTLFYLNIYKKLILNSNISFNYNNLISKKKILQILPEKTTIKDMGGNLKFSYKPILTRSNMFNENFQQINSSSRNLRKNINFKPVFQKSLFYLYVKFSNFTNNTLLVPHTRFKSLFITNTCNNTRYINTSKLFHKWNNSYSFLINLFYSNLNIYLFSNKILKKEVTSFNWSFKLLDYSLFKHTAPFFIYKDTNFGSTSTLIFKRLEMRGLNTVFLTDLKYHEKNLYFLKTSNIYTVGLVTYTADPWSVHYSIPVANNSIIIQFFFIKMLTFFKQYSEKQKYQANKRLWK